MRQISTKSKGDSSDQDRDRETSGSWDLGQDHAAGDRGKVRNEIKCFHNPQHQSRQQAIARYSGLILDLQGLQPASISEIAEITGQSTSTTRNHLRQLMQLDLVIKTSFEHHTLYCVNGRYNVQITRVLGELYE